MIILIAIRWVEFIAPLLTFTGVALGLITLFMAIKTSKGAIKTSKATLIKLDKANESIKKSSEMYSRILFDEITRRLFENIQNNKKLAKRVSMESVSEKQTLAQTLIRGGGEYDGFIDLYLKVAIGDVKSIFIESGSTFAYLGLAMADWFRERGGGAPLVLTNNILVQQTLVFESGVAVDMLSGTPAGQYGATFGSSTPPGEPPDLIEMWRKYCPALKRSDEVRDYKSCDFYIGAESQHKAMEQDIVQYFTRSTGKGGEEPKLGMVLITTSRLSLIDGPHVGSFQNRDFKELLCSYAIEHKVPVYLVLCADKIHEEVLNKHTCVSIFGEEAIGSLAPKEGVSGFGNFMNLIAHGKIGLILACANKESRMRADSLIARLRNCKSKTEYGDNFEVIAPVDNKVRIVQAVEPILKTHFGEDSVVVKLRTELRQCGYNASTIPPKQSDK